MYDKNIKYVVTSVLAAVLITLSLMITPAQAAVQTNIRVPIETIVTPQFIPCANGGQGEDAVFSGTLHVLLLSTFDNSGGGHFKFQFNPQGVIATGQTTGDIWHGTGLTEGVTNFKTGIESTSVNNFRLIGPGNTVDFLIHSVSHITVNPDGKVTVVFDKSSIKCD